MICKFCGTESNASNCPACGMPMTVEETPRSVPAQSQHTQNPQSQAPQEQVSQNTEPPSAQETGELQNTEPQAAAEPEVSLAAEPQAVAEPEIPLAAEPQAAAESEIPLAAEPQAVTEPEEPQYVAPEPAPQPEPDYTAAAPQPAYEPAPQYAAPQQPTYGQAPQYTAPQQPVYGQAPQYAQPAYTQQPQYAPQSPDYPSAPQYVPDQSAYQQPPQYAVPQAPVQGQVPTYDPYSYAQPAQQGVPYPPYADPMQDPMAAQGYSMPPQPPKSRYAPAQPAPGDPVNFRYAPKNPNARDPVNNRYAPTKQPPRVQAYSKYTPTQQPERVQLYSEYNPVPEPQLPQNPAPLPVVSRFAPVPSGHNGSKRKVYSPLRLKKIVWPALALMLPLLYLFFECFAVLSDNYMADMMLATLFDNLTGGDFSSVTVGEIVEFITPGQTAFYQAFSPWRMLWVLLSEGFWNAMPDLLPIAVVVFFALACFVLALLLLITGGRILHLSIFNSIVAFFGAGAVAAPLLGSLVLRIYCMITMGISNADYFMQGVAISPEALLIMCLLFCALRPALEYLRDLAGRVRHQEEYPLFPYRLAIKSDYIPLKLGLLFFLLCGAGLCALYAFLPISTEGTGIEFVKAAIGQNRQLPVKGWCISFWNTLRSFFTKTAGDLSLQGFVELTMTLCMILVLAVLACVLLHWLISFLRVLCLRKSNPPYSGRCKRMLRTLGVRVRNFYMAPFLCYTFCYAFLAALIILFTPMVGHLDLSSAEETLSVFYATVFYIKHVGGLTSVYCLIALGGSVLWHSTKQLGLSVIVRTGRPIQPFE